MQKGSFKITQQLILMIMLKTVTKGAYTCQVPWSTKYVLFLILPTICKAAIIIRVPEEEAEGKRD